MKRVLSDQYDLLLFPLLFLFVIQHYGSIIDVNDGGIVLSVGRHIDKTCSFGAGVEQDGG